MKLQILHEENGDEFGIWLKKRLKKRLMSGDSKLKGVLESHDLTLDHVRIAIEKDICLKNLGATYLEQTISNTLRDMVKDGEIPLGKLNDARNYFHLDKMSKSELMQERKPKIIP